MTRTFAVLAIFLYTATVASAASLFWDKPHTGNINLERADAEGGPFAFVATISAEVPYKLTPGDFGYFRVTYLGVPSNVVHYSLDVNGNEVLERLTSIEGALIKLAPTTSGNLSVKPLDANRIEITGLACSSLKTTGSGLKRVVECVK
jgi:hypothetical protein